ncbi:hypothetical protein [Haloarcula litorea]|nr:hypothetical protein [Halomicroarcula sp. GDY20]
MGDLVDTEAQIGELSFNIKKEYECPDCGSVHVLDLDVDGEVEVTVY